MPNGLQVSKYADHLRACADFSKEIASRLDIRDDSARQACFATVVIGADRHNLFLEPLPMDTKTPVNQTVPASVDNSAERDEAAAQKADAQIKDITHNSTPEQADGAKRIALLEGIHGAVKLLNKEGHVPPITPGGLNAYIKDEFPERTNLGSLDTDDLERLIMLLSSKLDVLREKKNKTVNSDDF